MGGCVFVVELENFFYLESGCVCVKFVSVRFVVFVCMKWIVFLVIYFRKKYMWVGIGGILVLMICYGYFWVF